MVDTSIVVAEGHVADTALTREKMNAILNIANPTKILELGFGRGDSAELWLELASTATVESVDKCNHSYTAQCGADLQAANSRFTFTNADSHSLLASNYTDVDLVFIDADHSLSSFQQDLTFASNTGASYIVVDDYSRKWFGHIIDLTKKFVDENTIPYTILGSYDYDSSDGSCTMALLERT